MKKISWLFVVMLLFNVVAFAQDEKPEEQEEKKEEIDQRNDEDDDRYEKKEKEKKYRKGQVKTLSGNNYHSGGFGAISFKGRV